LAVTNEQTRVVSQIPLFHNFRAHSSVQGKLLQPFLLSGGPNGRLTKGDAIVQFEFNEASSLSWS
jgi:hypothetical protein